MAASSRVIYRQSLPGVSELGADSVLLFDRQLIKRVPGFRRWAAQFPFRFEVEAGEGLKSLEIFSDLARKLVRRTAALPVGALRIVGVGGGSVGDFAGFLASVFKRGVDLVHVPSTWLAAIDSSHGGKTALNVGGAKNQLGTFYPASRIYLVKELLLSQPEERAQDALGELSKIALIDGRPWVRNLMDSRLQGGKLLWRYLPEAVDSKYRVVDRDPFEKKRIRQLLNLGHTLGHVLEAYHGLAHGDAVGQGLLFALQWSEKGRAWAFELDSDHLVAGRFAWNPFPSSSVGRDSGGNVLRIASKGQEARYPFERFVHFPGGSGSGAPALGGFG